MCLNRTSELKVMTIWISRELPFFNFDCLDMVCAWIGHASENLWPFEFLESFNCSISSVSIYYPPESDLRVKSYDQLNFSRASVVQFLPSRYIMGLNHTLESKVMAVWICQELSCSILIISIYYWPKSDIQVKRGGHLNLTCASMFNFDGLDILCAWIGYLSGKLWPSEFLESFRYSILSV